MRAVGDAKGISYKPMSVVLMGDGKTERVLMEPLAEKLNGAQKILLMPSTPLHWKKENSARDTGLSALQAVKVYLDKYGLAGSLFLVDKEHFEDQDNLSSSLESALRGLGITVQNVKDLGDQAFLIMGLVGSHEITVGAVVLGEKKCIEENIAKLINLEWGIKVEPDKASIHRAMCEKGCDLRSLVKNAKNRNLTTAFPGLITVLKTMEEKQAS